jgi:hypothetical protein
MAGDGVVNCRLVNQHTHHRGREPAATQTQVRGRVGGGTRPNGKGTWQGCCAPRTKKILPVRTKSVHRYTGKRALLRMPGWKCGFLKCESLQRGPSWPAVQIGHCGGHWHTCKSGSHGRGRSGSSFAPCGSCNSGRGGQAGRLCRLDTAAGTGTPASPEAATAAAAALRLLPAAPATKHAALACVSPAADRAALRCALQAGLYRADPAALSRADPAALSRARGSVNVQQFTGRALGKRLTAACGPTHACALARARTSVHVRKHATGVPTAASQLIQAEGEPGKLDSDGLLPRRSRSRSRFLRVLRPSFSSDPSGMGSDAYALCGGCARACTPDAGGRTSICS